MQDRVHAGTDHREQRNRLGEAVERVAPLAAHEQKQRRNQRSGMADAEPPHVIVDREGPIDGNVEAPDSDATREQHGHRDEK